MAKGIVLDDHANISVIPAKAGIHFPAGALVERWIPAFAGMTVGLCYELTPPNSLKILTKKADNSFLSKTIIF
jgi:hypothetical protein